MGAGLPNLPALPGVLAYGSSAEDAKARAKVLALRVIADRYENGEPLPGGVSRLFEAA